MFRFTESTGMCGCGCKLASIISTDFKWLPKLPGAFPLDCTHVAEWASTIHTHIHTHTRAQQ